MTSRLVATTAAFMLLGAAYPLSAAWADDAQVHQLWLDQQTTQSQTTANPSTRIPDTGRAFYQDDSSVGTTINSRRARKRMQ